MNPQRKKLQQKLINVPGKAAASVYLSPLPDYLP
jgi:hypothetical protein